MVMSYCLSNSNRLLISNNEHISCTIVKVNITKVIRKSVKHLTMFKSQIFLYVKKIQEKKWLKHKVWHAL